MKLKFKTRRSEDLFYSKLYDDVTESLYNSDYDYIGEIYKDLDTIYRYGENITERLKNEVLFWIESEFEDCFGWIEDDLELDWSEEIKEFLNRYWFDLIREMDRWFKEWE